MNLIIKGKLNYLNKVEDLNMWFSSYHFMKEFGLVNANQFFLEKLYPDIILPNYEFHSCELY